MVEERYFVEERSGCIAVRDRENTDPEYQGLHADTEGVVWYEHGEICFEFCPTCNQKASSMICLKPGARERAESECRRLNGLK